MSKGQAGELGAILSGAVTSTTVGSFFFEAIGAIILGILGAIGGWIANHFLRPRLEAWLAKKSTKKAE
jgi:hypothetical protein